jgi:hypothetical protein
MRRKRVTPNPPHYYWGQTDQMWLHQTLPGSGQLNWDKLEEDARWLRREPKLPPRFQKFGQVEERRASLYIMACDMMNVEPREDWWNLPGVFGAPNPHPKFFAVGC